jgi:ribosome-associated protein
MPSERASAPPQPIVSAPPQPIVDVPIRGDTIRLGQLLKLAGEIDSGAGVKALLAGGAVTVNGEPELRRGRQLHAGDTVRAGGRMLRVATDA